MEKKFYYGAYQFGEVKHNQPAYIMKVSDELDGLSCETIHKTFGCFEARDTNQALHKLERTVRDLSRNISPITHLEFDMTNCYKVFEVHQAGNQIFFEQEEMRQVEVIF